jgi:hypothetical protein
MVAAQIAHAVSAVAASVAGARLRNPVVAAMAALLYAPDNRLAVKADILDLPGIFIRFVPEHYSDHITVPTAL